MSNIGNKSWVYALSAMAITDVVDMIFHSMYSDNPASRDTSISFAGINLELHTLKSLLNFCENYIQSLNKIEGLSIRLINSNTVVQAYEDNEYKLLLNQSGINVIDGLPLSILANARSLKKPSRVRGPSFFRYALSQEIEVPQTHVLIGSTEATLQALTSQINKMFPNVKILGFFSPPFKNNLDTEDLEAIVEIVKKYCPTFTWIGLGTPKQDLVSTYLANRSKTIAIGVGAAFDFVAGTKTEAPRILQSTGLEWLFRLLSEPKRLGKRYVVGNVKFLSIVFFKSKKSTSHNNR